MELNNSLFKNMLKNHHRQKNPETVHNLLQKNSKDHLNKLYNNFHTEQESSSLIKNKSGKNLSKTNVKPSYTIQLIKFQNKQSKTSEKKKSTKPRTKKKGESRNINQLNRILNSNNYFTTTIGNNNNSTKNNFNNYLQSVINNSSTSLFNNNNQEKKYLITVNTNNYKNAKKTFYNNNINNSKKEKNIMIPLSIYTNNKFYENKIALKPRKINSIVKEQSSSRNKNNDYNLKEEIKLISNKLNRKNNIKIKKEIKVGLINFPKKSSTDKLLQQKTRSVLMKNINDINPCEKKASKNKNSNINLTVNLENEKKLMKKAISRNKINKNTYFDTKLTFNDEMKKNSFQNHTTKNINNSVNQTNLNKDPIQKTLKEIQTNGINKIYNIRYHSKTKRVSTNKNFKNQYYPRVKYRNKAKNYNRVINMPLKLCKKFAVNKHHQNDKKINIGVVNIIKEVFKPNLLNFNYINSVNNINSSNSVGCGEVNIIKKIHNPKNFNICNKIHNINNTLDNIYSTSNFQNDNSSSIVNNYNYSKGVSKEKNNNNKNNKISYTCSVNRNKNRHIIRNGQLLNKIMISKLTQTSTDIHFLSKNKPKKINNLNNINKISQKNNSSRKRKKITTKISIYSNLKNGNDKIKHHNTLKNNNNEKPIKEESKEESKDISKNNIENKNKKTLFKNLLFIDEYMDEIFFTLLSEEKIFISKKEINPLYLRKIDCEITPEIRTMVVDWIIELHQIFEFRERTLFITVQILDKYLSKKMVSFEDLQLLAITALNIASKQEEVEYPILDNYITVSGDILTKKELISMENKVLAVIDYKIVTPSVLDFFEIMSGVCDLNPIEFSQALYLMNIIILDVNMLKYNVSILAFAILNIVTKKDIKILIDFIKSISEKMKDEDNKKIVEEYLAKIQDEKKINKLTKKIRVLFRTLLKTHYQNAQIKFATQKFHAISTYSVI